MPDARVNRSYAASSTFQPLALVAGVLFVGIWIGAAAVGRTDLMPGIGLVLLLSCLGLGTFIYRVKVARLIRMWEEADERVDAQRLKRAVSLSGAIPNFAQRVRERLADADAWLHKAETEFAAGAFGPFWDAVENAARHLGSADDELVVIVNSLDEFRKIAATARGQVPTFPSGVLPSPRQTADRLREVVRKGQTSYQFASIYEQRRTNQILVAGFTTLNDALERLGGQLASRIDEVQARLDELIQFQDVRRPDIEDEAHLRDIQWRRRPDAS